MHIPAQLAKHLKDHALKMEEFVTADYSHLDANGRKENCAEVRKICATAAAAIAPMPIPFADIWTITPVQILMVRAIANIYGYKFSEETVKEVFAVVGGGWLGQQVCLALFKIGLPGAGGIGGAAFVWAWTQGMGKAAELYFQSGMKMSKAQVKSALKEEVRRERDSAS